MVCDLEQILYELEENNKGNHWWTKGRQEIILSLLLNIAPSLTRLNILDVGCGTGTTLNSLRQLGCTNLQGVDDSVTAIEYCNDKTLPVQQANVYELPFSDNSFDIILAMDVMEHVPNEQRALNEIKRVLKDDGLLLITVPAFELLWSVHDDVNNHIRRYTKKHTNKLLSSSGFSVLKTSYFNMFLFPFALLRKFSTSKQNELLLKPPPRFINRALLELLRVEKRILSTFNMPFGISLVNLARKNS